MHALNWYKEQSFGYNYKLGCKLTPMHLHKIWILLAQCYIENTCCNVCKTKPLSNLSELSRKINHYCHRWLILPQRWLILPQMIDPAT